MGVVTPHDHVVRPHRTIGTHQGGCIEGNGIVIEFFEIVTRRFCDVWLALSVGIVSGIDPLKQKRKDSPQMRKDKATVARNPRLSLIICSPSEKDLTNSKTFSPHLFGKGLTKNPTTFIAISFLN